MKLWNSQIDQRIYRDLIGSTENLVRDPQKGMIIHEDL